MEHSESLISIAKALCAAQTKMKAAKRDAKNPFYKSDYTTLESVVDTFQHFFSTEGLAFSHVPGFKEDKFGLHITLIHSSGEWLSGFYLVTSDKPGPQALGSAVTYARRYSLHCVTGIPSEDNDGEGATDREREVKQSDTVRTHAGSSVGPSSAHTGNGGLTEPQVKRIFAIAKKCNWSHIDLKDYLAKLGLEHTKDLNYMQMDKLTKNMEAFPKEEVLNG